MNYRGSYRKLLKNAQAAMIAAIEIYNKPIFEYRDECTVILILNAWELLLKAMVSKNDQSVFYPKKRNQPYRTLSLSDALEQAKKLFPNSVPHLIIRENLQALGNYRNNAIHFYNNKEFSVLMYSLFQPSIVNFRDLLNESFGVKVENTVSWRILPLGTHPPIDIVSYMSRKASQIRSPAVRQYLSEVNGAIQKVEAANLDTGRLLMVFKIKMESVKKAVKADTTVSVSGAGSDSGPLVIEKTRDPNDSHPLRQKEVLQKIGNLHGKRFTSHTFQAIVWKHELRDNPRYFWQITTGESRRYSNDIVAYIRRLTRADLEAALTDYKAYLRRRARRVF